MQVAAAVCSVVMRATTTACNLQDTLQCLFSVHAMKMHNTRMCGELFHTTCSEIHVDVWQKAIVKCS